MSRASEAIAQLREAWRRRLSAHRAMTELAVCPTRELHRIAADLGLSSTDLRRFTCSHPGPSELMSLRLQQIGLDVEFVRKAEPEAYRDLARVCGKCTAWRQCKHDLARGDVQAGMDGYCLNSATIDALTVECHARQ